MCFLATHALPFVPAEFLGHRYYRDDDEAASDEKSGQTRELENEPAARLICVPMEGVGHHPRLLSAVPEATGTVHRLHSPTEVNNSPG